MTMRTVGRQNRSARRARQWSIQPGINATMTTAGTAIAFDLQAALETDIGSNLNNVTASAIRLAIGCNFAAGATIGQRVMLHYGVTWVGNDALGIGELALPDPVDDSADWMAHGARLISAESALQHVPQGAQFELVSDSMRKQRENNSTLVLILSASLIQSNIQVFVGGRVLFLLP